MHSLGSSMHRVAQLHTVPKQHNSHVICRCCFLLGVLCNTQLLHMAAVCFGVVCAAASDTPRVALLFSTPGPLPLEPIWTKFLEGVGDVSLPPMSDSVWESVLETKRISELREVLLKAGQLKANSLIQQAPCAKNSIIRVRLHHCTPGLQPGR
jgi:hypothetical protein